MLFVYNVAKFGVDWKNVFYGVEIIYIFAGIE